MRVIRLSIAAMVVAVFFTVLACGSTGIAVAEGDAWLATFQANPGVNVSGIWHSDDWGKGKLTQEGRNVSGSLDDYVVRGVVSGRDVYLLFVYGGTIYYTAHLKASGNGTLTGEYAKYEIADRSYNTYPMLLKGHAKTYAAKIEVLVKSPRR